MERIERGTSPGSVVRRSREKLNEAKLPEYIRIVESFGYTVTKTTGEKPNPEPVKEVPQDRVIPADGLPEEPEPVKTVKKSAKK